MYRIPLICFSIFLVSAAPQPPFDHTKGSAGNGRVIAFVGEQVFTREAPERPSTDETGRTVIRMDSEWQSRYRILEVLSGTHESPTIDFTAFDHYGTPHYSKADGPILLYVWDLEDGRYHSKYKFRPVYMTTQGDFATCGSPYQDDFKGGNYPYNIVGTEPPPALSTIEFKTSAKFDIRAYFHVLDPDIDDTLTPEDRLERQTEIDAHNREIEAKFVPPIYKRHGNTVHCRMGIPVKEAVRHELATSFRHRRVTDHCKAQFAHQKPEGHRGTAIETYEEYLARQQPHKDSLKACFERLYPSGWPYEK